MRKFFDKEWSVYLVYIAAALTGIWFLTKLWVPSGFAIAGHDSGLAVNASEFFKSRLYSWDPQGFGRDNSGYFGSLIMHFIDFGTSKLAGVPYAGNQLNIFFWISALFISAGIFAYSLKDKLSKYFIFLFPSFVTFNFYILQSIFIFERAKYSLLIAALLFLTIYLKMREEKISVVAGGILSSFVFLVFNGGSWLGLPLYGGLLVLVFSILVFEIITALKEKRWTKLTRLLILYVIIGFGFLILNAYSILPYASKFLRQDYGAVTDRGVISSGKEWLENLSQAGSYLNIFRLQGVPDWYTGETSINLLQPYAAFYTGNFLMVVLSFIFPFLMVFSFILAKSKEHRELLALFGIVLLLGAFFVAGSHPPLGFIYTFFYEYIPGFSIFRSPYYKFGYVFFIAATFLIAYTLSCLIEKLIIFFSFKYRRLAGLGLALVGVVAWFGFYNIVFKPDKIFTWHPGLTTRVEIPSYVNDFAIWLNKQNTSESRILLAPPVNNSWRNDGYVWGYWSLTNLLSVVANKPFVTNSELESTPQDLVTKLYSFIAEGDEQSTFYLSKRLGIDYILFRSDVLADSSWSAATSPGIYHEKIMNFKSLKEIASFGPWKVYKFVRDPSLKFYIANGIISINQNSSYLSQHFYLDKDSVSGMKPDLLSGNLSTVVSEYSCESCLLEEREALTSLPSVTILPNSIFYVFKERNEEEIIKDAKSERERIDAYLGLTLRRGAEIKAMWDSGVDTDDAVDSLSKMSTYLKEAYKIYNSNPGLDQYFEAKRVMDNINIVERTFIGIVSNYDFGTKKQGYRQGVLDVLWNIDKLQSEFPIIEDKNKLETEKVYFIVSEGKNNRNLYLDENTLPVDLNNRPVPPDKITFTSGGNSFDVSTERTASSLLKLNMPKNYGDGSLVLKFHRFPNLFIPGGLSIEQSPGRLRACILGSLANFNPNRKYRVEVDATKPGQSLRLFLKDGEINNGDSRFIQGQDEAEISPTLPNHPFYHTYDPSAGATGLKIYLCNSTIQPPDVNNFEFHEIISPSVVAIDELPQSSPSSPTINYEKIDPTHYRVNIVGATTPFILVFNESYNPFWQINLPGTPHFSINGYANAWRISRQGSYALDLFYTPQSRFKKGLLVTAIGFPLALILLAFTKIFRKKRNEK